MGVHRCEAKNFLGQDNYHIVLRAGTQPPKPEKFTLLGRGYDSLHIDVDLAKKNENSENVENNEKYEAFVVRLDYEHNYDNLDLAQELVGENFDDPKNVTNYRFEILQKDSNSSNIVKRFDVVLPAKENFTYLFANLNSSTTYLMKVCSINAAGMSEWTKEKKFKTLTFVPSKMNSSASVISLSVIFLNLVLLQVIIN